MHTSIIEFELDVCCNVSHPDISESCCDQNVPVQCSRCWANVFHMFATWPRPKLSFRDHVCMCCVPCLYYSLNLKGKWTGYYI